MKYCFVFIAVLLMIYTAKYQSALFQWSVLECEPVFFKEDTEPYLNLEKKLSGDKRFLKDYAIKLLTTRQYRKADSLLEALEQRIMDTKLLMYRGNVKVHLKDTTAAIGFYQKAADLVPNRFIPKSKIMEIYISKKDTASAEIWAKKILAADVKVRSPTVDSLKHRVATIFPHLLKPPK